jgi:predicted membrane channel-forming protein YqfA (hemolysin III family)
MLLGLVLIAVAFLLHWLSARAIGGSYVAYRDHILGFFLILVVSGAVIGIIGWRFWRGRPDITALLIGIVSAILGVMVYIQRFHVHG